MRSTPTILVLLAIVALLGLTPVVFAQTAPPPASPVTPPAGTSAEGVGGGAAVIVALVGLLVIVGAGVKLYDLKRKREADAVHLQAQVSDALLRDPSLFAMPVTPTVHVPMLKGSPAVIEVSGHVPTPEAKEAAMRIIQAEAARVRPDFVIEDRVAVVPMMERRAA